MSPDVASEALLHAAHSLSAASPADRLPGLPQQCQGWLLPLSPAGSQAMDKCENFVIYNLTSHCGHGHRKTLWDGLRCVVSGPWFWKGLGSAWEWWQLLLIWKRLQCRRPTLVGSVLSSVEHIPAQQKDHQFFKLSFHAECVSTRMTPYYQISSLAIHIEGKLLHAITRAGSHFCYPTESTRLQEQGAEVWLCLHISNRIVSLCSARKCLLILSEKAKAWLDWQNPGWICGVGS